MNTQTKILVVEDQFVEANLLRLMLKRAGYTVCGVARSVEEARKKVVEDRPGLVLLDIFLSGRETGIDLANYLREEGIAFVYLSASSNEDILQAAKSTLPFGFLVKPFRDRELLMTLEIAQQHMEHGMGSVIRKEALFQQQLKELIGQPGDWNQRLLFLCRAIQPLIPFDYMAVISTTAAMLLDDGLGFLRMGYGEYRTTSMEVPDFRPDSSIRCYTGVEFEKRSQPATMEGVIAKTLGMRAQLTLPVPLLITGKGSIYISFYSRQPDGFTEQHMSLAERMQQPMIYMLENILARPLPATRTPPPSYRAGFEGIIGESPALLTVFDHATQVASSDTSVLITGESGTGKERIAGSIHALSPRRQKPFIKVNCAALPVHLIESELFGHEKGAFTGAYDRRIGKFEQADGGSFFLDEIGELPLDVQAKLLRVLQEKEIERIGGRGVLKVDVRIIAATNRKLEKEVAEGRFRLDLYYRLNVFPIHMPPLRERQDDIPLLVRHFVDHYNRRSGKNIKGVSEMVMKTLQAYHWPGNIRELESFIERSVLLEKGTVIGHIPLPSPESIRPSAEKDTHKIKTIEENEREHIINVLKQCEGRIRGAGGAAEILGVPPTTLASKIKKLGIRRQFVVILLAILLLGLQGKGQKTAADSFLKLSGRSQDKGAYDSGMIYAREAIYLFTQADRQDQLGESYVMLWSNMSLKHMPVEGRIEALTNAALAFDKAGNKRRGGDCYKEIGDMRQMEGKWGPALSDLKKALQLFQESRYPNLQGVYDLLGNVSVMLEDYKEGLRYGLLAVATALQLHDTTLQLCTFYNHLGMAYDRTKNYDNARINYDKALQVAEQYHDLPSIAVLVNNAAALLIVEDRPREALKLIAQVQQRNPGIEKDIDFRLSIPCVKIVASLMLRQYDKARASANELEDELKHPIADYEEEGEIYKSLLKFYIATGDYRKAVIYSKMFDKFCDTIKTVIYTADSYLYKFKIDSAKGRYTAAILDYQKYRQLNDSVFDETRSRQVSQFNVLYETEEKEKNIRLLEQQAELQKSHLRQATILRNFILSGAALLLIILFLLYRRYKTKQRTNLVLQQHQEEIHQKNESLQRLVSEKEWLLKEIHHRVKNNLHMVVGLLASQSEYLKGEEAHVAITESQHRIQAMSLIHQKLYQTENLSSTNMPSYILELVDYLKSTFDKELPICFTLNIAAVDFPLSHSIPIALILNEAIVNAIKYAFPDGRKGEITISLSEIAPQHFKMSIRDNGIGLPEDFSFKNNASLGATLMQGLSDDIGGRFSMVRDRGTLVELIFSTAGRSGTE